MPEYSNNSHYTENSINNFKQDASDWKLVGNDPKKEKGKLEEKINSEEVIVGDCDHKTRLIERIAGGSFGEVYLGEMITNRLKVAVKLEPQNTWIQPTLLNEGSLYRKMGSAVCGVPHLYWFGFHGNDYAAMILDLLGSSLYNLWVKCEQEFTTKTMLMVVDQMITSIQHVHERNCIHRDISPNNFAISAPGDPSNQLFIFDFGQAQKVAASPQFVLGTRMQRHVIQSAPKVAGTPRFSSVFSHLGQPPSYRDDMESLGYVWIYLMKGRLPWQGVRADSNDLRLDLIGKRKLEIPLDVLCDGLPIEFSIYMNYIRGLGYLEVPNYGQIREMFRQLASTKKIEYDWNYDWIIKGIEKTVAKDDDESSEQDTSTDNGNSRVSM